MNTLRRYREQLEMTQVTLAHQAGVDQARISKIERGKETPTLAVLLRIAEALKLSSAQTLDLGRELANLPAHLAPPNLAGLPLEVDGQAVELLELLPGPGGVGWSALVRAAGRPEATTRRVHVAGLSFLPLATVRAA